MDFDMLAHRFGGSSSLSSSASSSSTASRAAGRSRSRGKGAAAAAQPEQLSLAQLDILRYTWAKAFHVSPFFGMDHTYEFIFSQPSWKQQGSSSSSSSAAPTLLVQSRNILPSGVTALSVQLLLERRAVEASRLFWLYILFWAFPLLTFRVQIWIHVEALRLWFKGAKYYPKP